MGTDESETDVEVGILLSWRLIAFTCESKSISLIHTWFYFNLLVCCCSLYTLSIEANDLLLIAYGFDTTVIEFLKSCWHVY